MNDNRFPGEAEGFPKDKRKVILDELIGLGIFEKTRPVITNRGICHIIVDCNMPYMKVKSAYASSFGVASAEEEARARKAFDRDEWVNIFFFFKFKKYLEWDSFDETHHIRRIPEQQISKYNIEMCQALLEDGRIPVEQVLKLYSIPMALFDKLGVEKSRISSILDMAKGYL